MMVGYLHCILLLYFEKVHSDQNLSSTHHAFVIFDQFKSQMTDRFLQALEHNNIHVISDTLADIMWLSNIIYTYIVFRGGRYW